MRIGFAAGVWGMTLAIAGGAGTAPCLAQTQGARFQPYFAVRTIQTQDKFGKTLSTFYSLEERDASGRRLTARLDSPAYGGKLTQASVWDPVKLRMEEINYVARMATVTQFPPGAADKLLPASQPFAADDSSRSDLGQKVLDGFDVRGYTWTTNDPNLGDEENGGRPAVAAASAFSPTAYPVTHEAWWSPVLELFVLTTAKDGSGNQETVRYDQIKVKEPTAEDFQIPPGFRVRTIQAMGGKR